MTQDAAADAARPRRPLVLDADGSTALALGAEARAADRRGADPLGERRPPRIPFRLLVAALAGVLLLTGSAFGTRAAADVDPTAFAIFDRPASAEDEQALEDLVGIGAPFIGEARVLSATASVTVVAARAPQGTGARVIANGGYPPSGGPVLPDPVRRGDTLEAVVVPESAEICLWMLSQQAGPTGRCASERAFAERGLAASAVTETLEVAAFWAPGGSADVEGLPLGPVSLDEVRALEIPALEILETLPIDDQAVIIRNPQSPDQFGEEVLALRELARSDGWRMSAGIFRPEPEGGLAACVRLAPEERYGEFAFSCTSVARFVDSGAGGGVFAFGANVTWTWEPDGTATISLDGS